MSPAETITVRRCGARPGRMQHGHQQSLFARLWGTDVVLRLYLLCVYVRIGGANCFRSILEQLALSRNSLCRIRSRFFNLLYVPSARFYSPNLQLLPDLRRYFTPSSRRALALSESPANTACQRPHLGNPKRGRSAEMEYTKSVTLDAPVTVLDVPLSALSGHGLVHRTCPLFG